MAHKELKYKEEARGGEGIARLLGCRLLGSG